MLKKKFLCGALGILTSLFLVGCEDPETTDCPDRGQEFFAKSLDAYYSGDKHSQQRYEIVEGAKYDPGVHIWMVPFKLENKRYLALMRCSGDLELSVLDQ